MSFARDDRLCCSAANGAGGRRELTEAAYGEKNAERLAQRDGYRDRTWETRTGAVELRIPKLHKGSYFPGSPGATPDGREGADRRGSGSLCAGRLDPLVDDLVQGMSGISKSQVSRLCAEIADKVKAFLARPLEGDWPYLWIDATYVKVRQQGRIVSVAVDHCGGRQQRRPTGDSRHGYRPLRGRDVLDRFLRQLARRCLRGVKLVVSDSHEGIKATVAKVLNAAWQRCRVGALKKLLFADSVLVVDSRSAEQTRCWDARSGISWSSSSRAR
ncbi:transposase (plasmid) [Bradyrhizobium sp. 62B]|nr:transposase [Bradyrhizobium sp. 62B]